MKKIYKTNNIVKGAIVDNNNKQLFARLYGETIVLISRCFVFGSAGTIFC